MKQKQDLPFITFFIGIVYFFTMHSSVAGGDSGELASVICNTGVIHPPGYPLYTIIGKLFSLIPLNSPAWRLNLFSVITSLASLWLLALIIGRIVQSRAIPLVIMGLLAFSPLYWQYSIQTEVFALNNFLVVSLIYFFVRFFEDERIRWAFLMALVFGLGASHHHTIIFVGLPLAGFVFWRGLGRWLTLKRIFLLVGCFLLGLLPYIYLPLAANSYPLVSWGAGNTWGGFWTHFFRHEYGTFQLASQGSGQSQLLAGLKFYAKDLFSNFIYLGPLVLVVLARVEWKHLSKVSQRLLGLCGVSFVMYLIIFLSLTNLPIGATENVFTEVVRRFFILPHVLFVIGLGVLLGSFVDRKKLNQKLVALAGVLAVVLPLVLNFSRNNERNNFVFRDFGINLVRSLPQGAILFSKGDTNTNSIRYVQACEGVRRDVRVIDRSMMSFEWYKPIVNKNFPSVQYPGTVLHPRHPQGFTLSELFRANFKRPIFTTKIQESGGSVESLDKSWRSQFELVPYGLTYAIYEKGYNLDLKNYSEVSQSYMVNPMPIFEEPPESGRWERVVYDSYWLAIRTRIFELVKRSAAKVKSNEALESAVSSLEAIIESPVANKDDIELLRKLYTDLIRLGTPKVVEYTKRLNDLN